MPVPLHNVTEAIQVSYPATYAQHSRHGLVPALADALRESEAIDAIAFGKVNALITVASCIICASQDRVLVLEKAFGSTSVSTYPYHQLSSVSRGGSLGGDVIAIAVTGGANRLIVYVDKNAAIRLVEAVNARIRALHSVAIASDAPSPSSEDLVSKLERLAHLKAQGLLTADEFQSAKDKLLALK